MSNDVRFGTAPRVFIVEDELLVAMDVEMQLTKLGYEVAGTADRGSEALRLISATRPDVVLMDINLRGSMDGIAIAAELQQRNVDVPVIFVTAYGSDEAFLRAQTVSFSCYLSKPYQAHQLHDAIHNALQRKG